MSTRTKLFHKWSDDDGVGLFLGHNKMKQENSINMLMKIVTADPDSAVIGDATLYYNKQDLKHIAVLTIQLLAMEPLELFPNTFMWVKALFELKTPMGTLPVMADKSIISVLEEKYTLSEIITYVKKGEISYQLTIIDGKNFVNSDVVNDSQVYVKINKNNIFAPAAYKVSDPDPAPIKYHFYGETNTETISSIIWKFVYGLLQEYKNNKMNVADITSELIKYVKNQNRGDDMRDDYDFNYDFVKDITLEMLQRQKIDSKWMPRKVMKIGRIKLDGKQGEYDKKVTEWICRKMAESNPYDVWLKMLTINKDRAKRKGYTTKKAEYLKSMLSWSLNSYVMLQNAIGKKNDIPKLSYLDLQYADRELKLFRV